MTKRTKFLVDVVLDSGAVVRCTPEHLWMLRNGEYKEAQDLRPGIDRLMPINRIWPVNGGYERVTDKDGTRTLTHHMVASYYEGPIKEGFCVHHHNNVKVDNTPGNLSIELLEDHARSHTSERHRTDPEWRAKLYEGATKFNNSPEGRKSHSEALKRTHAKMSPEDYKRRARNHKAFRADIDIFSLDSVRKDLEATNANAAARILGCGRNVVMRVLRENDYASWDDYISSPEGLNHKVRYVIPVELEYAVAVYYL
jgi:hypothetical protein